MQTRIPDYNLNHFKVFMAVYQTGSMTGAAEVLHLTQSGVSQHIQALEEELGRPLFSRVGRKLLPTEIANQIYPDIAQAFLTVGERLNRATGRTIEPEGVVRIGMPIEFGVNVLVPKLTALGQKYRKITFDITLDYGSILAQSLAKGDLDFAFIDESPMDRRLEYKPVDRETLLLCASRDYMARQSRVTYLQSYFEKLEYIEYRGQEPILRRWMLHHLKRKNLSLNVRAHIMDVQGLAKFIINGLGAGVLPDHLVARLKKDGVDLYVFEGKSKPLTNEIRMVRLKSHPISRVAELVMNGLLETLGPS
ncbi:MAG: LysR family transcriptional regulator [Bdellovibrionales bacterium]